MRDGSAQGKLLHRAAGWKEGCFFSGTDADMHYLSAFLFCSVAVAGGGEPVPEAGKTRLPGFRGDEAGPLGAGVCGGAVQL